MSTPIVAQTIAFLFPQGEEFDEDIALSDSGIQSAFGLSLGGDMIKNYGQYVNQTTGTSNLFTLTFLVSAANAAVIVAGVPALITRMKTALPIVTRIVTWGENWNFN